MLTSKEIKSLPKGQFSNKILASVFPKQGKQKREKTFPVDRFGNIVKDIHSSDFVGFKTLRLNRSMSKRFSK